MKVIGRMKVPTPAEVEATWLDRVRRWKASGRTAREFAEMEGVTTSRLHGWASRLRNAGHDISGGVDAAASGAEGGAKPVQSDAVVEVVVAGVVIRVGTDFDEALLRRVVATLGVPR